VELPFRPRASLQAAPDLITCSPERTSIEFQGVLEPGGPLTAAGARLLDDRAVVRFAAGASDTND
jgi:hypothetical protein